MADLFRIVPYQVRSAGTDVPPEEVQAAINSLASQTQNALNSVGSDPTGPAGGDLSGNYPNPTVSAVHATSGTLSGVTVNSSPIGQTTPAAGAFTTLTATTPLPVTSGGTGLNALTAAGVLVGTGSTAVTFANPGVSGTILSSAGVGLTPAFQSATALFLGQTTNPLSQFASTTSAQLAGVISDETGTGSLVFATSPTLAGTPLTTTAAAHTNTTQIASTAYVQTEFGAPPSIGNVTPGSGAFTTLSASSTVSGTGFSTYLASPPAIGGTTPAAGSFTTLSSTGNFTPSQTNGIVGTTTNNNANAGSFGEYTTATGLSVAITSVVMTNVASISLTAGDWDVTGLLETFPAGTTTQQYVAVGVSSTSATFQTISGSFMNIQQIAPSGGIVAGLQVGMTAPETRFSLSSTTTIFLVAQVNYAVSTLTVSGLIRARRVR